MTTQTASLALAPADLGTRLIAVVIDGLVLGLVYLVLITIIAVGAVVQGDINIVAAASRSVLWALLSAAYFAYGWTKWKASPGQRVMGLRPTPTSGTPPPSGGLFWNDSGLPEVPRTLPGRGAERLQPYQRKSDSCM